MTDTSTTAYLFKKRERRIDAIVIVLFCKESSQQRTCLIHCLLFALSINNFVRPDEIGHIRICNDKY